MYISVREFNSNYSKFVEVDELLNSSSYKQITAVYEAIKKNINSYESSYSGKLKELNEKFRQRIIDVIDQEQKGVATWKKVVSLGIYCLILRYQKKSRLSQSAATHASIGTHLNQIEESTKVKKTHKSEEIEKIKKLRKVDDDQELARLMANERIAKSLDAVEQGQLNKKQKIALGHSIEIRECLKGNYYVVNHGQNIDLMVINVVARLLKKHYEAQGYDNFQVLRHDVHLKHINAEEKTVDWFQKNVTTFNNDHSFRRELICGDVLLESCAGSESALSFFKGTKNIAAGSGFMGLIVKEIVSSYFPNKETHDKLTKELLSIAQKLSNGGNLYSIAVPKEKFHEICYLSRPYGVAQPAGEYTEKMIEAMQKGLDSFQKEYGNKSVPQVRVLSHKLTPENGVYIDVSSTLSEAEMKAVEKSIDLLIQRAQMQFRL